MRTCGTISTLKPSMITRIGAHQRHPLFGFSLTRQFVTLTDIKGVGWLNIRYSVFFPTWTWIQYSQKHSKCLTLMTPVFQLLLSSQIQLQPSDRTLATMSIQPSLVAISEPNVHLHICHFYSCVLAFVERWTPGLRLVRSLWVQRSHWHFWMLLLIYWLGHRLAENWADTIFWRYQAWAVEPTLEVSA